MRKRLLILIAIIVVLGGALFFVLTNTRKDTTDSGSLIQKTLNLFPFGKNETTVPATNDETTVITNNEEGGGETEYERPRLRKLSTRSVAGATSIVKKREVEQVPVEIVEEATVETTTATPVTPAPAEPIEPVFEDIQYVRYIERASGNIFDIAVDEEIATRITNTTIPRISEAHFTENGQGVLLRYLQPDGKTISTWNGNIITSTTDQLARLGGNFLEENITTLSVSPDGNSIFYMRDIGDVTYGYTALTDGTGVKQIFDSSFSEWLSTWSRTGEITLTAKASGYFEGYSYALSTTGSTFRKVLGSIFGLTLLPDTLGDYSVFSYTTGQGMQMKLLNEKTGEQTALPINTFPEKCVWSKYGATMYCAVPSSIDRHVYPDDWYQGTYFTTDSLWKISVNNGIGMLVSNVLTESGESVDAISLGLTQDESMLYFINKRDGILWGVEL